MTNIYEIINQKAKLNQPTRFGPVAPPTPKQGTYPEPVERWRSLVSKYFRPEDVDKALWVINWESGGNPGALGDGGFSHGLFQVQDNRRFEGRPDPQTLKDPEANIRWAAQAVYGGSGWQPWGEGATYQGRPFGALGNHPYGGSSEKTQASLSEIKTFQEWHEGLVTTQQTSLKRAQNRVSQASTHLQDLRNLYKGKSDILGIKTSSPSDELKSMVRKNLEKRGLRQEDVLKKGKDFIQEYTEAYQDELLKLTSEYNEAWASREAELKAASDAYGQEKFLLLTYANLPAGILTGKVTSIQDIEAQLKESAAANGFTPAELTPEVRENLESILEQYKAAIPVKENATTADVQRATTDLINASPVSRRVAIGSLSAESIRSALTQLGTARLPEGWTEDSLRDMFNSRSLLDEDVRALIDDASQIWDETIRELITQDQLFKNLAAGIEEPDLFQKLTWKEKLIEVVTSPARAGLDIFDAFNEAWSAPFVANLLVHADYINNDLVPGWSGHSLATPEMKTAVHNRQWTAAGRALNETVPWYYNIPASILLDPTSYLGFGLVAKVAGKGARVIGLSETAVARASLLGKAIDDGWNTVTMLPILPYTAALKVPLRTAGQLADKTSVDMAKVSLAVLRQEYGSLRGITTDQVRDTVQKAIVAYTSDPTQYQNSRLAEMGRHILYGVTPTVTPTELDNLVQGLATTVRAGFPPQASITDDTRVFLSNIQSGGAPNFSKPTQYMLDLLRREGLPITDRLDVQGVISLLQAKASQAPARVAGNITRSQQVNVQHTIDMMMGSTDRGFLTVNQAADQIAKVLDLPTSSITNITKWLADRNAEAATRAISTLGSPDPSRAFGSLMDAVTSIQRSNFDTGIYRYGGLQGQIIGLSRIVDNTTRFIGAQWLNQHIVRPWATEFLKFAAFVPMNVLETGFRAGALFRPGANQVDVFLAHHGDLPNIPYEFSIGIAGRSEFTLNLAPRGNSNQGGGLLRWLQRQPGFRHADDWSERAGIYQQNIRARWLSREADRELTYLAPEVIGQVRTIVQDMSRQLDNLHSLPGPIREAIVENMYHAILRGSADIERLKTPVSQLELTALLNEAQTILERHPEIEPIFQNVLLRELQKQNGRRWADLGESIEDGVIGEIWQLAQDSHVAQMGLARERLKLVSDDIIKGISGGKVLTEEDTLQVLRTISDISVSIQERITTVQSTTTHMASTMANVAQKDALHQASFNSMQQYLNGVVEDFALVFRAAREHLQTSRLFSPERRETLLNLVANQEAQIAAIIDVRRQLNDLASTVIPNIRRKAATWTDFYQQQTAIWNHYHLNNNSLIRQYNALAGGLPQVGSIPKVEGPLTAEHVAELFSSNSQDLSRGLVDATTLKPKDTWIATIQGKAEGLAKQPAEDMGFTSAALSNVYDGLIRDMGLDPGNLPALAPVKMGLEGVRQELHLARLGRGIHPNDYDSLVSIIDDVARKVEERGIHPDMLITPPRTPGSEGFRRLASEETGSIRFGQEEPLDPEVARLIGASTGTDEDLLRQASRASETIGGFTDEDAGLIEDLVKGTLSPEGKATGRESVVVGTQDVSIEIGLDYNTGEVRIRAHSKVRGSGAPDPGSRIGQDYISFNRGEMTDEQLIESLKAQTPDQIRQLTPRLRGQAENDIRALRPGETVALDPVQGVPVQAFSEDEARIAAALAPGETYEGSAWAITHNLDGTWQASSRGNAPSRYTLDAENFVSFEDLKNGVYDADLNSFSDNRIKVSNIGGNQWQVDGDWFNSVDDAVAAVQRKLANFYPTSGTQAGLDNLVGYRQYSTMNEAQLTETVQGLNKEVADLQVEVDSIREPLLGRVGSDAQYDTLRDITTKLESTFNRMREAQAWLDLRRGERTPLSTALENIVRNLNDETGSIDLTILQKLLKWVKETFERFFKEERGSFRLGGDEPLDPDVARMIGATTGDPDADLAQQVSQGQRTISGITPEKHQEIANLQVGESTSVSIPELFNEGIVVERTGTSSYIFVTPDGNTGIVTVGTPENAAQQIQNRLLENVRKFTPRLRAQVRNSLEALEIGGQITLDHRTGTILDEFSRTTERALANMEVGQKLTFANDSIQITRLDNGYDFYSDLGRGSEFYEDWEDVWANLVTHNEVRQETIMIGHVSSNTPYGPWEVTDFRGSTRPGYSGGRSSYHETLDDAIQEANRLMTQTRPDPGAARQVDWVAASQEFERLSVPQLEQEVQTLDRQVAELQAVVDEYADEFATGSTASMVGMDVDVRQQLEATFNRLRAAQGWLDAKKGIKSPLSGALENIIRHLQDERGSIDPRALSGAIDYIRNHIVGGPGTPTQSTLRQLRELSMERARVRFETQFTDYSNDNFLDAMGKSIFPFWTYESQRWPYVWKTLVGHPGIGQAWNSYMTNTEGGYIEVPYTDLSINPLRGTVLMGGLRGLMSKYPEYYDNPSSRVIGPVLDGMGRYGFYPGLPAQIIQRVTGSGELDLPPMYSGTLNALVALNVPGAQTLREHIYPDKFRDYNSVQLASQEAQRRGLDYSGVDIFRKIQSELSLTPEESDIWNTAQRKSAGYQILFEQTGLFKLDVREKKEANLAITQMIESLTGITADQQAELQRQGKRISDVVTLPPSIQRQLYDLDKYKYWSGLGEPLYPKALQAIEIKRNQYWQAVKQVNERARTEGFIESNIPSRAELEAAFRSNQISAEDYLSALYNSKTQAAAQIQAIRSLEIYKDVPITLEERRAYAEKYGTPLPVESPWNELQQMYYELTPQKDPISGQVDWLTYFATVDTLIESLPEPYQSEFLEFLHDDWTETEKLYWAVNREYLRPYTNLREATIQLYSPEQQEVLRSYVRLDAADLDQLDEDTTSLITDFEANLEKARSNMRQVMPTVDAWLYFWGRVTTTKSKAAASIFEELRSRYRPGR